MIILAGLVCFAVVKIMQWMDTSMSFNGKKLTNIVDQAKAMDKDQFYTYEIKPRNENSKELILVRFNTDNKESLGVIDEFGNVIQRPTLEGYDLDEIQSVCKYGPGEYPNFFEDKVYLGYGNYEGKLFDSNLNEVKVTEEEIEAYLKSKFSYYSSDYDMPTEPIPKKLKKQMKDNFDLGNNGFNLSSSPEYYRAGFSLDIFPGIRYLLFDKDLNIVGDFYYKDGDNERFSIPQRDSKVAIAVVRNLGLVYFNVETEKIIWITYVEGC